MHLTNYKINKESEKFIYNYSEDDDNLGHKRHIRHIWNEIANRGYNIEKIWQEVTGIIIKIIISAQPQISHSYKSSQPNDI